MLARAALRARFTVGAAQSVVGAQAARGLGIMSDAKRSRSEVNLFAEGLKAKTLLGEREISLDEFQGKAVLVCNVAST